MNKNLIYIVGAVAFAVLAIWLVAGSGGDEGSSKYSASSLTAVEANFDFNTISMEDGDVSHSFELRNEGAGPVRIEEVYTSCGCTTASITDSSGQKHGEFGMPGHGLTSKTNIEVGPGESVVVEAIFDPAAHGPSGVGLAQRSIYLETNSQKSPKLELSFQVMVIR